MPAGVWRSAPSSASLPDSSTRFAPSKRRSVGAHLGRTRLGRVRLAAALHQRLRLLLLHHRRGRGYGLGHPDDQMAQHGVAELERMLELVERLLIALDVHQHVVRLVDLL